MSSAFYSADEASKKLGVSPIGLHILANHKRLAEFGERNNRRYRSDQVKNLRNNQTAWINLIPPSELRAVNNIPDLVDEEMPEPTAEPTRNQGVNLDKIIETYLKNLTPQQLKKDLLRHAPHLAARRALHVGSFDPPTMGHLWVIEQGAALFDELIVGVGINPSKAYTFTTEERISMLEELVKPYENVTVKSLGIKLSAKFAKANQCNYILQGIRNQADYEYQKAQRYANSDIADGVEPYYLFPPRNLVETSSSFVKSLVGFEDWEEVAQRLVPPLVFERLKEKLRRD